LAIDSVIEGPRVLPDRLEHFLSSTTLPTPFLVVDSAVVLERYERLAAALPGVHVYYAVKANPHPGVLDALHAAGSRFDVASTGEIDLCTERGIAPRHLSFGNTVKTPRAIAAAHALGVQRYTVDSHEELVKVLEHAPGAEICVRLFHDCGGADWPLSRKFGCSPADALSLVVAAHCGGASRTGCSFHVGSQQRSVDAWDAPLAQVAEVFAAARAQGARPDIVNLGGGFPGVYLDAMPAPETYGAAIMAALRRHFGRSLPELMVEPGRYLVADAGVLRTEVVLVSRREVDHRRWVYLDCGKFGGLAETMDESIRYRIRTPHDGGPDDVVVLAGPSCDSADVLYDKTGYRLPLALRSGDHVEILSTGAYTTTYSSVGFNGFPPLTTVVI
jgi:ornithine decarboxylase